MEGARELLLWKRKTLTQTTTDTSHFDSNEPATQDFIFGSNDRQRRLDKQFAMPERLTQLRPLSHGLDRSL